MSQPESKQSEPSKMKKLLNGGTEESPMAKLQRSVGTGTLPKMEAAANAASPKQVENLDPVPVVSKTKGKAGGSRFTSAEWKFLPAFWTIASVMSFTVNIVLLIIVAILLQNMSTVGVTVTGISDQLLGGLYENFVKMDQAHIKTTIPVSKEIPVQFNLSVSGPTSVTLTDDVTITGALVTVNTGGLNINNARANIVLPQGTVLPVYINGLAVPVDQKVLAELNVDVDIPLSQTELHEPFSGLQDVVRPYYCLIKPGATSIIDNSPVCSQNP
jgi:hypothetical protein